jgi:hypothetical protein
VPEFIKNFADAWVQWWNASEPISRYLLWGHPVFFWSRIGKLLEVVGALFIVIDWIGRDQINKVTAKLVIVVDPTYAQNADGWPRILSRLKTLLETGRTFRPH